MGLRWCSLQLRLGLRLWGPSDLESAALRFPSSEPQRFAGVDAPKAPGVRSNVFAQHARHGSIFVDKVVFERCGDVQGNG